MEEANKRINQILAMDEEDYTDEIIEEFVQELKGAKFLIPMEVDEESIDLDSLGEDEEIELSDDVEFVIIKMEDEDGNEFIPVFTGDFETEIDLPGTGLVMDAEDLALLLFDEELDNEKMDSIYINPFTDYPAEMGFYNYLELFDLIEIEEVECDDPDCDDPSHLH